MMAGKLFEDKNQNEQKSVKSDNKISWSVFETKSEYVSKIAWFLEDWVKQMKKDMSKLW
jgi:hypothetical protein